MRVDETDSVRSIGNVTNVNESTVPELFVARELIFRKFRMFVSSSALSVVKVNT